MHDPMVVAFEVRRPWPRISKMKESRGRGIRGAFWRFGRTELYWPSLITVWHVEPGGADSLTVCGPWQSSRWKWHVHHWHIQVAPLQDARRWLLTRCAWCDGRSRRRDRVNIGRGWESPKQHWWQGEVGLYHSDCLSIEQAHLTCICELHKGGPWDRVGYDGAWGDCVTCGRFRKMGGARNDTEVTMTRLLQTIPLHQRDAAITAKVEQLWAERREMGAA